MSGKPGTCDRDKTIDSRFVGQNGRAVESSVDAKVQGCKPKIAKASGTSHGVTLRLTGIGAGRITVSGHGLAAGQRKIASATEASVVAKLTTASRNC